MRIGLDISICAFNNAGSARHALCLLAALERAAPEFGAEVVPLQLPARLNVAAPGLRRKALVLFWELVYMPRLMGLLARAARCDLVHVAGLAPLAPLGMPTVATVHDLLPALYPGYFPRVMGLRLRRWLKLLLRNADYVIASSQHTAQDLGRVPVCGNVSVIYPGSFLQIGGDYQGPPSTSHQPYILTVGTLEPRKNLVAVLRAYRLLLEQGAPPPLLIVGAQGWMLAELAAEMQHPALAERVRALGYVSDEELAALYGGAAMLVYPSLYEGFGFPPLEAMSCGCPVVSSNVSSLPEVVGDAGLLVDPTSHQQIAGAMRLLLEQPALAEALRQRGYAQASRFSWERCARETFAVYAQALQVQRP